MNIIFDLEYVEYKYNPGNQFLLLLKKNVFINIYFNVTSYYCFTKNFRMNFLKKKFKYFFFEIYLIQVNIADSIFSFDKLHFFTQFF